MTIPQLRTKLERLKGHKEQLQKSLSDSQKNLSDLIVSLENHIKAREIIREVGMTTQQQLQYHISDITSLALNAVFDDPYELKVNFVQRRNKTECDLLFVRDGKEYDPIDASGVGTIDVASFALRIASWSMKRPRTRNTIILDEPMRYLSAEYQERASQMIKELSDKLKIQFIIVTHEEILTSAADKIFTVKIKNGISSVSSN